jgi:hypothetical protein
VLANIPGSFFVPPPHHEPQHKLLLWQQRSKVHCIVI